MTNEQQALYDRIISALNKTDMPEINIEVLDQLVESFEGWATMKDNLSIKINKISEAAKNKCKPDLQKYGKNFRAISDSAVLEILNPLLKEHGLYYEVIVKERKLTPIIYAAGSDNNGSSVERYVFLAEVVVSLVLHNPAYHNYDNSYHESCVFEGWGSGIDVGDKATGKAITAAVKYALFKGFRLQYSNDPDAEVSEEIEALRNEKTSSINEESQKVPSGSCKEEKEHKKEKTKEKEELATDKMRNYIVGLVKEIKMTDEDFKAAYGITFYDKEMTMRKAREIIEDLKSKKDSLPF